MIQIIFPCTFHCLAFQNCHFVVIIPIQLLCAIMPFLLSEFDGLSLLSNTSCWSNTEAGSTRNSSMQQQIQCDVMAASTLPSMALNTHTVLPLLHSSMSLIGSLSLGKEGAGEERTVLYAQTAFQESISLEIFFFTLFSLIVSVRHQRADSIYIEHLCLLLFFSPHICVSLSHADTSSAVL